MRQWLLIPLGTCPRVQLVLVHAEDDQTMPWNQTEELFQAALKAANENSSNDEAGAAESPKVTDLGEAGRQEVWQNGSRSITMTIAKHGGTYPCPQGSSSAISCCTDLICVRIAPSSPDPWLHVFSTPYTVRTIAAAERG